MKTWQQRGKLCLALAALVALFLTASYMSVEASSTHPQIIKTPTPQEPPTTVPPTTVPPTTVPPTTVPPTSVPPTTPPTSQPTGQPTNPPATGQPTTPPTTPQPTQPPGPPREKEGKDRGGAAPVAPSGPPPAKFAPSSCARVTRPDGMPLNDAPGFDAQFVQQVNVNQAVRVLAGPVGANNLWWWQFRSPEGRVGWGVGDYAEPAVIPCVAAGAPAAPAKPPVVIQPPAVAQPPVVAATAAPVASTSSGTMPRSGLEMSWIISGLVLAAILITVTMLRRRGSSLPGK